MDFLPLSVHELPVLLAAPNRSGLQPPFPAWPIRCSAFRPWSASLALPTACLLPLLTSAPRSGRLAAPSVPNLEQRRRFPQVKSDRLHRTPAGSTDLAFDGYGLRESCLLVRPRMPPSNTSLSLSLSLSLLHGILGRTSGQRVAKSISIKGQVCRSGGGAVKAIGLTWEDSRRCSRFGTEGAARRPDRGAEVSRGHSKTTQLARLVRHSKAGRRSNR